MSRLSDLSGKELLVNIANGNKHAFEMFYLNWESLIYHNISIFIQDEDDRLDILQDVFVAIWQKRAQLQDIDSISSFVFILCRNKVFNFLRNSKKKSDLHKEYAQYRSKHNDNIHEIHIKDIERVLEQQLERLPPKMRQIFELSRFEDLSHQEISDKLGISKLTVKKQVQNALKVIKSGFHLIKVLL